MEKEPLISVIIPVYNGEKYIRPCIENILNQSYKNLEIIVVNDGSSDQSGIIAQEYPIQVIHLGQNRGLSTARNVGIDTAKGLYRVC
ncbi:Glycosyl transferase family 2 [Porphyromonadaceae bacterium KH3R12]|nr:Glycosyl transferase family 2 [Porphyromonadaceae bacterium KH3R12]